MTSTLKTIAAVAEQIGSGLLPDNAAWKHRFEIRSTTSNRSYVIAQRRSDNVWGCSCTGWRHHRKCKHVKDVLARLAALADRIQEADVAEVVEVLRHARTAYLDLEPAQKVARPEEADVRILDL